MPIKTKSPTPVRTELIRYSDGCRVEVEGRISAINSNGACTCIEQIKINGERVFRNKQKDHLWFQLKHNLGKGDTIKFKAKIGCYKGFGNYGILQAKSMKEWYG